MLQIFRVYALYQSRAVLGVLLALVGMACAISGVRFRSPRCIQLA